MEIAKHDGTEYYAVDFGANTPLIANRIYYFPVPGGVVMLLGSSTSVFIPMVRLEFEWTEDRLPTNVHLTSTMPQLMQGAAMASILAMSNLSEGG